MDVLQRMPWLTQNAVFQRLADVAEVSKLTKQDRLEYDHALKRYRDTLNGLRGAKEEGRAEGLAEGEQKKALESACKMKAKGYPLEDIVEITGLTAETVSNL